MLNPESGLDSLREALAGIDAWGARFAAVSVSSPTGILASHGDTARVLGVASITKLTTAWTVLVALEEGTISLEDPLGPPGSTVAHLLAHAGGWGFDTEEVLAAPGTRRIYSNTGYEALARHLEERAGIPFATYLREAVLEPLGMRSSELRGSAAKDLFASVDDLMLFVEELRRPRLVDPSTAEQACTVRFAGLGGVLPGWGRQDPCDWGYGPEIRGSKAPHWSGTNAPAATLGHFGGSGTFVWLDPDSGIGCVALGDRPFGDWALRVWPAFSDRVRTAAEALV
ncbi:MAG: beta-lactamase family protein [Microthrixaceae bacterium]|nr:beta-lactamase family protein [Microthrixaceae bacterium]